MNLEASQSDRTIYAAGGVVWRQDGGLVAVVHRPRYDDWSLPKGKLEQGEHPLAAAVREVAEEAGVRAVPRFRLPLVRYWLGGRPKVVEYWAMTAPPAGIGEFLPNSEVDGLAWLPVTEAVDRLSYQHDVELLRGWGTMPPVTGTVLLIRHAGAGERWPVGDARRPLSSGGAADAVALCRLLALFAPERLVSATPVRCRQTLVPLATDHRLSIEVDPVFDEVTGDPVAAVARLAELASTGATVAVCSQGAVIPPVMERIAGMVAGTAGGAAPGGTAGPAAAGGYTTAKGDGWVLPYGEAGWFAPASLHAKRVRQ